MYKFIFALSLVLSLEAAAGPVTVELVLQNGSTQVVTNQNSARSALLVGEHGMGFETPPILNNHQEGDIYNIKFNENPVVDSLQAELTGRLFKETKKYAYVV